MATKKELEEQEALERSKVGTLKEENLSLANQLSLSLQIKQTKKEELDLQKELKDLGRKAVIEANKYEKVTNEIKKLEKELIDAKKTGNKNDVKFTEEALAAEKKRQAQLKTTAGGALKAMELEAKKRRESLMVEQKLIKDINKERGIGGKIADLFRTKQEKQKSIDIARAKVGGGTNTGPGAATSKSLKETLQETKFGAGVAGIMSKLAAGVKGLGAPVKEAGNQLKGAIAAPLADAANLLTGESYGMGGGKANASGATSILGGLSSIAKTIPFIGGLLGGLVDAFKAMVDAVLGVDQANFRVGRALNISSKEADKMRKSFDGVALASNNIVVNSTRMLQSQIEISKQLGTNAQLSSDILVNDVKLRDVLGLEAESRQKIAEASIVTGKNAEKLTQSTIGTVLSFNKLVGTSFKFNDIIAETSKLSGFLGLSFAKYPDKITKAVLATKTLGFELGQVDKIASSFLDFESSISKEMEAQVLTGKDMNLTLAREAALNNDNAKLAQEITKNVGSTSEFLGMNRIRQEAIAEAVGLSRDSLADILKKQELYSKLGATDVATFNKKIELLEKQGKTQQQISDLIGKDAYNTYTQVSTAEKLTEIMERIKKVFVDFIRNTGIFDFLTKPEKMNAFIVGLADKIAGAVSLIGRIIGSVIDLLGTVTFGDTSRSFHALAEEVRGGAGNLSTGIRSTAASLGGALAPSLTGTVESGVRNQREQAVAANQAQSPYRTATDGKSTGDVYLDGYKVGTINYRNGSQIYGLDKN